MIFVSIILKANCCCSNRCLPPRAVPYRPDPLPDPQASSALRLSSPNWTPIGTGRRMELARKVAQKERARTGRTKSGAPGARWGRTGHGAPIVGKPRATDEATRNGPPNRHSCDSPLDLSHPSLFSFHFEIF
uniref:Uncharacterized protein n=1 Tax=Globodera rostochiensis TaxID=31243 RepID=A0A914H9Q0_GLORO